MDSNRWRKLMDSRRKIREQQHEKDERLRRQRAFVQKQIDEDTCKLHKVFLCPKCFNMEDADSD